MSEPIQIDEGRLRQLWAGTMSARAIAAEFGCSPTTIYAHAKIMELPLRRYVSALAKTKPAPAPTTTLQARKDYPQIMAAVARGVKPGVIATWFRLKRGELAGVP